MAAIGGGTYYGVKKSKAKKEAEKLALDEEAKALAAAKEASRSGATTNGFYGAAAAAPPTYDESLTNNREPVPLENLPAIPNEPTNEPQAKGVEEGHVSLVGKRCVAFNRFEPEFEDDMAYEIGDVLMVQEARSGEFDIRTRSH